MRQDGKISWSTSDNRQEGTDLSHKGINRQKCQNNEMATRQSRLRRYLTTRMLPLKINANLPWHSHGRCRPLETIRHRQNRSKSLSKSVGCMQHGLKQSHPEHHDQHSTRW